MDHQTDLQSSEGGSPGLLDVNRAAAWLGVSASWLNKLRITGEGPRYLKFGTRAVRYSVQDLRQWIEARAVTSTSEYNTRKIAQ